MSMWCNWCHQGYIHPSFARFLIEKDVHLKQNLISMYKQTALNVTKVEGWRRKFPLRLDQNVGMAWFIAQTLDKCAFSFYPCAVVSLWLCTACIEMLNFSRNLETFYLDVFFSLEKMLENCMCIIDLKENGHKGGKRAKEIFYLYVVIPFLHHMVLLQSRSPSLKAPSQFLVQDIFFKFIRLHSDCLIL